MDTNYHLTVTRWNGKIEKSWIARSTLDRMIDVYDGPVKTDRYSDLSIVVKCGEATVWSFYR